MLKLITAPTAEIITLNDIKGHSRITSYSFADDVSWSSTIDPGSHNIGVLAGTGVDVSGSIPLVVIDSRANGAGGTVIIKIQESNDNLTFTDWYTFATITEANDNTFYEKEYTGTKLYIRAYYTVAGAACNFGVTVQKKSPYSSDDSWFTTKIQTVRQYAEDHQSRAYLTQVWEMVLEDWPCKDSITIPRPPLQTVDSIKYYGADGTEYTFGTDYYDVTNTNNKSNGLVTLKYGESWPSVTLRPSRAIVITFTAGFTSKAEFMKYLGNEYEWMLAAIDQMDKDRSLSVYDIKTRALDFNRTEWF